MQNLSSWHSLVVSRFSLIRRDGFRSDQLFSIFFVFRGAGARWDVLRLTTGPARPMVCNKAPSAGARRYGGNTGNNQQELRNSSQQLTPLRAVLHAGDHK